MMLLLIQTSLFPVDILSCEWNIYISWSLLKDMQLVNLSSCQNVDLSTYQDEMSSCQNVETSRCQVDESSSCRDVELSRCQVVEMSSCLGRTLANVTQAQIDGHVLRRVMRKELNLFGILFFTCCFSLWYKCQFLRDVYLL